MTRNTFVYAYPDGQDPAYWLHEGWVLEYPKGHKRYFMNGPLWHPFPQGGEPTLRVHEGYVYDFPKAGDPRFYLREVEQ